MTQVYVLVEPDIDGWDTIYGVFSSLELAKRAGVTLGFTWDDEEYSPGCWQGLAPSEDPRWNRGIDILTRTLDEEPNP